MATCMLLFFFFFCGLTTCLTASSCQTGKFQILEFQTLLGKLYFVQAFVYKGKNLNESYYNTGVPSVSADIKYIYIAFALVLFTICFTTHIKVKQISFFE